MISLAVAVSDKVNTSVLKPTKSQITPHFFKATSDTHE